MKKHILLIISLFCTTGLSAAEIRVGVLHGPSCVPAVYLMDTSKEINGAELSFEKYPDATALLPKLLKKEVDIGFLPPNVACKAYNASKHSLVCAGITGTGNLYLITKDNKIKKLTDLKGKTVYVAGQGAIPEYMFKYLLEKNNIKIGEGKNSVNFDFSIPTGQIAAQLIAGKIEYGLVPEPFATVGKQKSKDIRVAIDLQKEYEKAEKKGSNYPMTVMVVRKDFAEKYPELVKAFVEKYKVSLDWTVKNPVEAGVLSDKLDLGFAGAIVAQAIPASNYVFVPAKDSKEKIIELLQLFLNNAPESIGSKLPEEDFFFIDE